MAARKPAAPKAPSALVLALVGELAAALRARDLPHAAGLLAAPYADLTTETGVRAALGKVAAALAGGTVPDAEELSRAAKALADRVSDPVTLPAVAAHIRRRFPV